MEDFPSSSLVALTLELNCGFIPTSVWGPSTGVCSWGCPGGRGSASVRTGHGGGRAAWIMGTLVARSAQGSRWPWARKYGSTRVLSSLWRLALKGPPWLVLLYYVSASPSMWGEKGYNGESIPCMWLSSSTPLSWLLSFPPKAFPAGNFLSPVPSSHLLQSTAVFPQNCSPVSTLHEEGNGNPLQYSWLENPMDGGAWWAAIYGVAQSRTRLKQLSSSNSSSKLLLPATLHVSGHVSLSRVCRALARIVCVVLTLFKLSQISCLTLRQPQMLPFHPNQFHQMQESLPSSSPPTPGHRSGPAGSLPPSPFLLSSYPITRGFI